MKPNPETAHVQVNVQGEGDYEAARRYNDATKRFVDSGAVPQAARDAAPKSPAQAQELQAAERKAAQHAKGEDPQVKRPVEDESADPVGDGHSDAEFAAQLPPPGHPNPAPDKSDVPPQDGAQHEPVDDGNDAPKSAKQNAARHIAY